MTEDEFFVLVGIMQLSWYQKPLPKEVATAWWKQGAFADLDFEDVEAAIAALLTTHEWQPMPSVIREWIARRANAAMDAVWGEIWTELLNARVTPLPWSQIEWSDAARPFVEHIGVASLQVLTPGLGTTTVDMAQGPLRRLWDDWQRREIERRVSDPVPAVAGFLERHQPADPRRAALVARIEAIAERRPVEDVTST